MQRYAPDTNFFIQFRRPEELPWSKLTNAENIELLILREVLGELDKHKNSGNARLARRSRDTIQLLRPLISKQQSEIVVREKGPRVIYRLAPPLSPDREKPPLLDMNKADCRIIEEILSCAKVVGDISLLTHDSLPMLTASDNGLSSTLLPDDWALPPEKDPKDKEIARLQSELHDWKSRAPSIKLEIRVDGSTVESITGRLPRYEPLSDRAISQMMRTIERRLPRQRPGVEGLITKYHQEDLETYARERIQWEKEIEEQLERYPTYLNALHSWLPIELRAENVGSAIAEDLVIEVLAEGQIRFMGSSDFDRIKKQRFTLKKAPRIRHLLDVFNIQIPQHSLPLIGGNITPHRAPPIGREFYWEFDEADYFSKRIVGSCRDFRHEIQSEILKFSVRALPTASEDIKGCIRIRFSAKNLPRAKELIWPIHLSSEWRDAALTTQEFLEEQINTES